MSQEDIPLAPRLALTAGAGSVLLAVVAFVVGMNPGDELPRAGAFVASGLAALGACVAFGALVIASALIIRRP
jgi:uncharacterized membrane protein YozB (DUF420 family)